MKPGLKNKIVSLSMLGIALGIFVTLYLFNFKAINDALVLNFSSKKTVEQLFEGLLNTALVTVASFALGLLLGMITCLVEKIDNDSWWMMAIKNIFKIYVSVFRGTPMVIQLLIIYFVVFMDFTGSALLIAILSFGLNSGAYVSEIFRGGINAVPKGQMEASRSLGLSYSSSMFHVILPQAFRNAFPSLANEFITLFKETSIVGFIGAVDLSLAFRKLANATFDYNTVYIVMGIVYFLLVYLFTLLFKLIEKGLSKHART